MNGTILENISYGVENMDNLDLAIKVANLDFIQDKNLFP